MEQIVFFFWGGGILIKEPFHLEKKASNFVDSHFHIVISQSCTEAHRTLIIDYYGFIDEHAKIKHLSRKQTLSGVLNLFITFTT